MARLIATAWILAVVAVAAGPDLEIVVCTLVHNENSYIPEWIEFHKLQGFSKFIIYDDNSRNPNLFLETYIADGFLEVVSTNSQPACRNRDRGREHNFVGCQLWAFDDCIQRYKHSTRWIAVFDVDEFLFSPDPSVPLVSVINRHPDAISFSFIGAVFGDSDLPFPPFAINSTTPLLVTEKYVKRQPLTNLPSHMGPFMFAHKQIASASHVERSHVHRFDLSGTGELIQFDIVDRSSLLMMHHYQYRSVFDSHRKSRLNGNPGVDFDNERHPLFNAEIDVTAAQFARKISSEIVGRKAVSRAVTVVLTSINRVDLLNRTLLSFNKYNTYPISRGIIVEDSGLQGNLDWAHNTVDFPLEIIYNVDLGVNRHHQIGQLGLIESVDVAYGRVETELVFHMEDDWEFLASGFIEKSLRVLDIDQTVLTVWLRAHGDTNGHPILPEDKGGYRLMSPSFGEWHGFTFNPGLRRMRDYLSLNGTFVDLCRPYRQQVVGELDVNILYHKLGFVAAILDTPAGFIKHIGGGRTTDPGCSHGCPGVLRSKRNASASD